ncbi:MAG: DnaJ domain-containing protein [Oscillospiraceae bacterium]|nr:DnaJ domain-containing protein [Oscillospiraceae bacterium]
MTDPYDVLGVSRDASEDEIKKAYRALVKKYHPDLHPGDPGAAAKMSEVNSAYDMIKSGKDSAGRPADLSGNASSQDAQHSYTYYGSPFGGFGFYGTSAGNTGSELDIAEILIRTGEYYKAKLILEGVSVRNARWYYLSALADYSMGYFESAKVNIGQAVTLDPSNESYRRVMESMSEPSMYVHRTESGGCLSNAVSMVFRLFVIFLVIQLIFTMLSGIGLLFR